MDGVQNDSQLLNMTYRAQIRQSCKLYGVPPNYFEADHSVFVRDEARNETLVKSFQYFMIEERERLLFRQVLSMVGIYLFFMVGE